MPAKKKAKVILMEPEIYRIRENYNIFEKYLVTLLFLFLGGGRRS